jgi:hypothetical protein
MAENKGYQHRFIGWAVNETDSYHLATCPICGKASFYLSLTFDFDDLSPHGMETEPEDLLEFPCQECVKRAEAICGQDTLQEMVRDPETYELWEETVTEVCQILNGCTLNLNA